MMVYRRLKIIASVVFVIVAFLLPTSCTTSKIYKGPDIPEDEIAVIRTAAIDYYGVFIRDTYFTAVDGVATDIFTNQVHVLPGSHSFNVKQTTSAGCSARTEYGVIGFEAEAGNKYEILMRRANGSQGVFIWVEDLDTGEIIAGNKPS